MRYDVNLSILFTELPLLERPAAARAAGFEAVELWWPFPVPVLARMGEDPISVIDRHAGYFGHVQIADVPGRGQPGTGEIDYPEVLAALDTAGYPGFVGLEYRPVGPSADSFGWLPAKENV